MQVQFGTNTPISSDIEIALDQAQKPVHIVLQKRDLPGFYVVVMRDGDAPNPDYIHLLVTNSSGNNLSDGDVVFSYYPPQRVGHRYRFEVYKSEDRITLELEDRFGVNFAKLVKRYNLKLYSEITVTTTAPNAKWFPIENRYCRCVLHEHAKGRDASKECAYLHRDDDKYCKQYTSFDEMPHDHLLAYAKLEGIKVPNPKSTKSIVDAILQSETFH